MRWCRAAARRLSRYLRVAVPRLLPLAFVREVARVLAVLPRVENGRLRVGPKSLALRLRAQGSGQPERDEPGRVRLRRVIAALDRIFPTGPNCYRRALLEMALDAGAAREPLTLGLRAGGGAGSGHAWLGARPDDGAGYDAEFVV